MRGTEYTVRIGTENAAFGETEEERAAELARTLENLARLLRAGSSPDGFYSIQDINGNRVGAAGFNVEEA